MTKTDHGRGEWQIGLRELFIVVAICGTIAALWPRPPRTYPTDDPELFEDALERLDIPPALLPDDGNLNP